MSPDLNRDFRLINPISANGNFLPLKLLGSGTEGHVVLAAPRSGPQNLASCVALKFLVGNTVTSVPRNLLQELKAMEGDKDHLLAAVRGYPDLDMPN
jgi:hypothetical protein